MVARGRRLLAEVVRQGAGRREGALGAVLLEAVPRAVHAHARAVLARALAQVQGALPGGEGRARARQGGADLGHGRDARGVDAGPARGASVGVAQREKKRFFRTAAFFFALRRRRRKRASGGGVGARRRVQTGRAGERVGAEKGRRSVARRARDVSEPLRRGLGTAARGDARRAGDDERITKNELHPDASVRVRDGKGTLESRPDVPRVRRDERRVLVRRVTASYDVVARRS
mmetsp:Transcript_8771/g.37066  ORF Transcript_8771/g.37066 Transcript_8771/m.37066 type:complete len:232 (-) Transcript_8771:34-729(-)